MHYVLKKWDDGIKNKLQLLEFLENNSLSKYTLSVCQHTMSVSKSAHR